ncbi:hypothetical protein [Sporichthya sp.]|uniref:hypothetical protein n=1 Tax=Sporichthya sp. TaxID=65475 RepID=UPI0017C4E540|nr:hypothetical protein [Sporichthya sp.]MBA3741646.1 hypothetical protein [Sporichthya sp.]
MSGKTRILGRGRSRGELVAEVSEAVTPAPAAQIVGQRKPEDPLQDARDLEDAAMAYSEVVHVLGAITKTTQAGESTHGGLSLEEMAVSLDQAWARWDTAQRRLIGQQRTG